MKILSWIWPWSKFARLRADAEKWHEMAKIIESFNSFQDQLSKTQEFQAFLHRYFGDEKMKELSIAFAVDSFQRGAALSIIFHPERIAAQFPDKEQTKEIDPKLSGVAQQFCEDASNRRTGKTRGVFDDTPDMMDAFKKLRERQKEQEGE